MSKIGRIQMAFFPLNKWECQQRAFSWYYRPHWFTTSANRPTQAFRLSTFRGFQKARVVWKRVLKVGTHNVEKCTFASYRVQQEQKERLSDVFNASNTLKVVYNLKRSGRKRDKDTKTAWKHEGVEWKHWHHNNHCCVFVRRLYVKETQVLVVWMLRIF